MLNRRESSESTDALCPSKLSKQTLFGFMTEIYTGFLCLYVADPATFLDANSAPGTLCSSENSLFIQL